MNDDRVTQQLLMVLPSPGLVRAAVAAGLEVWAAADSTLLAPDLLRRAGLPPQRLLPANLTDPASLRALLEHTTRTYGIDQILYSEGEVGRMLRPVLGIGPAGRAAAQAGVVVREVSRVLGRPTSVLPEVVTLRQLLEQGGYPGPHLGGDMPAGPRFWVQTLTVDGMHLVADITAQEPAASSAEAERAGIRATVRALLDLAGYEHGSVQAEVVLTEQGCHIAGVAI
ncbi:hypothetical protein OG930_32750 [Streptomyces sp. NBC_01799]|uniref:hypothetical protein n=1 Tax=Streptomyces sp. NBC_01800 TaxID=2975945 RepID=UPI002DD7D777|nr:hypothetical protein [Streptomyces sp. NBC_01800]WSA71468.1 hypothetical protein OIE65_33370 [Streptomyces sp. NBC_01800]WSA79980.1 hypothetical protein OG930_32750 [Streptomyces sp. NBC_01799]